MNLTITSKFDIST